MLKMLGLLETSYICTVVDWTRINIQKLKRRD